MTSNSRLAFACSTAALAVTIAASGCGNQMLREVSHGPLSAPRAAPPPGAIPYGIPAWDAAPSTGIAFGSTGPNSSSQTGAPWLTPNLDEPSLPPPNLSDRAQNQPSPKSVDALMNPLAGSSDAIEVGRTVFMNRCTQCHSIDDPSDGYVGPVGRYLVPAPPDLAGSTVRRRPDGALFWSITMGQGKMPGFRNWTTAYQRWALVSFVRSLKAGRPATTSTPYPLYGAPRFALGDSGLSTPSNNGGAFDAQ